MIENTIETFPSSSKIISDIRVKYGIKEGDIVAIYVGRLEKIKGAEVMLNHIPKLLNRHNIGPRLLISNKDYFVYRYIDGDFIIDVIKKSDKIKIKKLIRNIFSQMSALDKLKVDKEEMHRPLKHIIIKKDKPYLIDFERARHAQNPKNVTQFCQFLMSGRMRNILANKDIKFDRLALIRLAKVYKSKQTLKNFKDILKLFQYEG